MNCKGGRGDLGVVSPLRLRRVAPTQTRPFSASGGSRAGFGGLAMTVLGARRHEILLVHPLLTPLNSKGPALTVRVSDNNDFYRARRVPPPLNSPTFDTVRSTLYDLTFSRYNIYHVAV